MSTADELHRREFACQLLGSLGAASVLAGSVAAQDNPPPPATPEDPKAEKTPPVELLILSAILQNYPSENYHDESVSAIYRDIAGDLARGKQLRDFSLQNSDGPATVFRVLRANPEGTP